MLQSGSLNRISFLRSFNSQKKERILTRQVNKFFDESNKRYLLNPGEASLAQVKELLLRKGISESDMEYQICDFSETLTLVSGEYSIEFSRALFPKNRDHRIQLNIRKIDIWKRLEFSAENIADLTKAIVDWLPTYESIVADAELELKRILKICEIGMTYLQTLSDKLSQHGYNIELWQESENEETAVFKIIYGNGIRCHYTINLLEDFQEKFLEITEQLCRQ